jgi:hypothetical protein
MLGVPPPAPPSHNGPDSQQPRPPTAPSLAVLSAKTSGASRHVPQGSNPPPPVLSPNTALHQAMRKRLFSGTGGGAAPALSTALTEGDRRRDRPTHSWQKPGPVLVTSKAVEGTRKGAWRAAERFGLSLADRLRIRAGSPDVIGEGSVTRSTASEGMIPIEFLSEAAGSCRWRLATGLTIKQMERLLLGRQIALERLHMDVLSPTSSTGSKA